MSDWTGITLDDHYENLELIGSGSMGHVYRARDRVRGCPVAIKRMNVPAQGALEKRERRFRREAQILIELKHPNIVSLYEYEDQHDPAYLVMQYIEGQSLADRLADRGHKPLPTHEALSILTAVGWATHYAHSHKIYHRDIKPANILLDQTGTPYLADFGTALLKREDRSWQTTDGGFIGNAPYAAPEQWLEQEVDAPTDVYALGVLLYEMLTGRPPFVADQLNDLIEMILSQEPRPPSELNARIPAGIDEIVLKALRKKPQDRYASVAEMLTALEAVEFDASEEPRPKRSRAPLYLLGAIGAVLVVLMAGLLRLKIIRTQPGSPTPTETTQVVAVPTFTAPPTSTPTSTPTPSPSPTRTATGTLTPTSTPSPLPAESRITELQYEVTQERLTLYKGPNLAFGEHKEVKRGDMLTITGRTGDGGWWRVNLMGRACWMVAQILTRAEDLPVIPSPPLPTPTLTATPTPTPTLLPYIKLANAGFADITPNYVPDWSWWAYDNFDGGEPDPDTSYDTPLLKQADDAARLIDGPTLQIDAAGHLKFRVHIYQRVEVTPHTVLRFTAAARAYSDNGGIYVAAGIDPGGGHNCEQAQWSTPQLIDQTVPVIQITSARIPTSSSHWATVCLMAETRLSARSNAAFFDNAELLVDYE